MEQVTERLERTLQETHYFGRIRSYTIAGQTTIFVDLKDPTPPQNVPDIWYTVRKNVGDMRGTLPQGVSGRSSTMISAAPSASSMASPPTASASANCATMRKRRAPGCCTSRCVGGRGAGGAGRAHLHRVLHRAPGGLRLDLNQIVSTLQPQNLCARGHHPGRQERVFLRVTGAFETAEDIDSVTIVAGDRLFRLGDIANVRRGVVDPPQPMFRVNGKPAIGLAVSMRDSGDILALGENIRGEMAAIKAGLPVGIEPTLVADQSAIVDTAINDFLISLWQAIVIILPAASSASACGPAPWWRWRSR